jgi:hypothetical protein
MLRQLIGRTPIEIAKAIAIVLLAAISLVALVQLSVERTQGRGTDQGRTDAISAARSFSLALTTYDYAHLQIQEQNLTSVAAPAVVKKVRSAEPDLVQYQASSVGQQPDLWLQDYDGRTARVLVRTKATMQSTFAPPGTKTSGLVSCQMSDQSGGWRVTDYQWLTPVTETGPGYQGAEPTSSP